MKASAQTAHMEHAVMNMNSQEKAIMESNCTDDNICIKIMNLSPPSLVCAQLKWKWWMLCITTGCTCYTGTQYYGCSVTWICNAYREIMEFYVILLTTPFFIMFSSSFTPPIHHAYSTAALKYLTFVIYVRLPSRWSKTWENVSRFSRLHSFCPKEWDRHISLHVGGHKQTVWSVFETMLLVFATGE